MQSSIMNHLPLKLFNSLHISRRIPAIRTVFSITGSCSAMVTPLVRILRGTRNAEILAANDVCRLFE